MQAIDYLNAAALFAGIGQFMNQWQALAGSTATLEFEDTDGPLSGFYIHGADLIANGFMPRDSDGLGIWIRYRPDTGLIYRNQGVYDAPVFDGAGNLTQDLKNILTRPEGTREQETK